MEQARISDERSPGEKAAWRLLGPPLYYCADCLRKVKVTGGESPVIARPCEHTGPVIAPRRAIVAGEGGLSPANRVKMACYSAAAAITGRNV